VFTYGKLLSFLGEIGKTLFVAVEKTVCYILCMQNNTWSHSCYVIHTF